MNVLIPILIYSFYSSAVLLYGVGLKESILYSGKIKNVLKQSAMAVVVSMLSVLIIYPIMHFWMFPYGFAELYPVLCVFVVAAIGKTIETLINADSSHVSFECILPLCIVILALDEGGSFLSAFAITVSACFSFCIITLILYALRKRLHFATHAKHIEGLPILYISIGILVLILYAWNISWWNFGVI